MASATKVREALSVLACNFAGEITTERARLWRAALADVPDDDLERAVKIVVKTRTADFFPPVAVILQACRPAAPVDVEGLLSSIDKAGSYSPHSGWQPPRVQRVRELFGAAVAEAYGAVGGGSRLFAENETTRAIAAREFALALRDSGGDANTLPAPSAARLLPGSDVLPRIP